MNQNLDATVRSVAKDVYETLGSGHAEAVYDNAMQVGLRLAGIRYESQRVVALSYKEHCVGEGYPDLVVRSDDDAFVVVELKAVAGELGAPEEQQLRNYLHLLDIDRGLLINFQQPGRNGKKQKSGAALEIKEVKP